ncbi:MAG: hypothetical protein ACJAQZ_004581 [Planctomycetota bacterium]
MKGPLCADFDGFSLHGAVRVAAGDRKRLEHSIVAEWGSGGPSRCLNYLCAGAGNTTGNNGAPGTP